MDATTLFTQLRIVPVVAIEKPEAAVPLAECLVNSGIKVIEVTLRSDRALEAIENIAKDVPEILLGAGSIRRVIDVKAVSDAGAAFMVSPGATDALIDEAHELKIPYVPGASTASEALKLFERGYNLQKFFPAAVSGGIDFLKAVGAPLPEIRFVPTGGINADQAPDYLALKNVASVGGSWLTPGKLIDAGDFDAIGKLAAAASRL